MSPGAVSEHSKGPALAEQVCRIRTQRAPFPSDVDVRVAVVPALVLRLFILPSQRQSQTYSQRVCGGGGGKIMRMRLSFSSHELTSPVEIM